MYDDFYNMMNSYTQTTDDESAEQENQNQNYYGQQNANQNYYGQQNASQNYFDDYSGAQNYQSEQTYNPQQTYDSEQQSFINDYSQEKVVKDMDAPVLVREEVSTVTLTKTRQKIYLSNRLKLAVAVFAIIFFALSFISIYNAVKINELGNSFAFKESEISQISQSINELSLTYNDIIEEGSLIGGGYEKTVEGVNSFVISLDEFYTEPETPKVESNWFNDMCEFFSKLFA